MLKPHQGEIGMANAALYFLQDVWLERPHKHQVQFVLQGLTAVIPSTGITCLVGPSGSGKSTLLRLLNRLEDPTRGTVLFRGKELASWNVLDLRRRVSLVGQSPIMLPGTVHDNLEAGLRLRGQKLQDPIRWLDAFGLGADLLGKDARELSGGEKQRVSLVRALITEPEVLLLDEVTASLDPGSTCLVETRLAQMDCPIIWVSHDMAQVRRVAHHVLPFESGRVRELVRL